MPNALEKILDYIVAVILMFIIPICYFGIKKDAVIQVNVDKETSGFVELVSAQGYLTRSVYEKYLKDLGETNKLYTVELIHEQTAFEPEYKFRTAGEVVDEDEDLWAGSNVYLYEPVSTAPPVVIDPVDNSGHLNTETNESVLAAAVNTAASPDHVHTEECYSGHLHTGDQLFTHTHQHSDSCIKYTKEIYLEFDCKNCGEHNKRLIASYYWDTDSNSVKLGMSQGGTTSCIACGSTNVSAGEFHYGYGYSCGYDIDINGDGYSDAVGTGTSYHYIRTEPQDKLLRATYVSGCYSYHNAVYLPISYHNYEGVPYYDTSYLSKLYYYGIERYCNIPLYYTLKYGNANENSILLTYKARYVNGQLSFTYYSGSGIKNWESALPAVGSLQELEQLASNSQTFYHFLKANLKYTSVYEGEASCAYALYGSLDICGHTIANQWYPTCGQVENATLSCGQIVESIVPTHPTQTIYLGEPMITTAIVTYRDGSTKTVVCSTTASSDSVAKDQEVELTYVNSLAVKNTCKINLNVISRNKTCIHGHIYNLNNDGTDPGCPYCKNWLLSLSVLIPSSSKLTMYRYAGNSLELEGVGLLAVYLDGHTEQVFNGYIDNLDTDYVGIQNVTISYKGLTTTLQVSILRNQKQCGVCGLYYNLYMDDTDPGCPFCKAKVPIFTGNVMTYCRNTYDDEIITELYEGTGTYYFRRGDVFRVKVSSRNKSNGLTAIGRLFGLQIRVTKSDTIKDETVFE